MKHKFISLFSTNFLGVMNDNFLKSLVCFIAIRWVNVSDASFVVSAAAGALVLPYILLSPLAGRLSHIFSKKRVLVYSKVVEIPIMAIAIVGFMSKSVWMVVSAVFLMGIQSALYSPAKYGLIRDVGGEENLHFGVGGFEAISFFGMLSGTLIAAFLSEKANMSILYVLLVVFAILGLIMSVTIKEKELHKDNEEMSSINPLRFLKDTYIQTKRYDGLHTIIMGLSFFWWLVASLQMGIIIYCQITMGLSAWYTGILMSAAAVGVTSGCLLAGIFEKRSFIYRWVVPTSVSISLLFIFIFFVDLPPLLFGVVLFVISILCGFFKVPLDTSIQQKAKGDFLPIVLAYFNQISFIFILLASATLSLTMIFLPAKFMFLVFGVVFFFVPIYIALGLKPLLCYCGRRVLHLRYKVEVVGLDNINNDKTCLILPNHQAIVDPMILFSEFYNKDISPIADEFYVKAPLVGNVVRLFNAIAVPDLRSNRKGLSQARALDRISLEALGSGKTILLYPSGHITLDGAEHIGAKQLAYKLCKELPQDVDVIGVRISGLWGSAFSRYGRSSTPQLLETIIKSLFSGVYLFKKRREVKIEIINITERVKLWSEGDKLDFNKNLEEFYN